MDNKLDIPCLTGTLQTSADYSPLNQAIPSG